MTLQQLRYLVAVADTGNFGRAADRCRVGQPTLSTQLGKLEDALGVRLFERTSRRVVPTPEGRAIIAQARTVLDGAERIQATARAHAEPMAGPFRLGVIPTVGPYLLPRIVGPVRHAFPQLGLYLREEPTAQLIEQLRAGRLEATIVALPLSDSGLAVAPLFTEPFLLATHRGHRLAAKSEVAEGDLRGESILLLEEGHCLREQALAVCHSAGSDGPESFQATSLETLRHMVAIALGCTLLPALADERGLGTDLPDVVTRPFQQPAPARTVALVWRRGFPGAEGLRALARVIRSYMATHVPAVNVVDETGVAGNPN